MGFNSEFKGLKILKSVCSKIQYVIVTLLKWCHFFCAQTSVLVFLQVKLVVESIFSYLVFDLRMNTLYLFQLKEAQHRCLGNEKNYINTINFIIVYYIW